MIVFIVVQRRASSAALGEKGSEAFIPLAASIAFIHVWALFRVVKDIAFAVASEGLAADLHHH